MAWPDIIPIKENSTPKKDKLLISLIASELTIYVITKVNNMKKAKTVIKTSPKKNKHFLPNP